MRLSKPCSRYLCSPKSPPWKPNDCGSFGWSLIVDSWLPHRVNYETDHLRSPNFFLWLSWGRWFPNGNGDGFSVSLNSCNFQQYDRWIDGSKVRWQGSLLSSLWYTVTHHFGKFERRNKKSVDRMKLYGEDCQHEAIVTWIIAVFTFFFFFFFEACKVLPLASSPQHSHINNRKIQTW